MNLNLNGKTALITGGSKGIGRACAEILAAEGCHLHLAARGEDALQHTKALLESSFAISVTCHSTDVSDGDAARKLAETCRDIDILINNAGAIPRGDLWQIEEPGWRDAWDLKVFGYINLCRAVYPMLKSRGGGVIINVIGAAGARPMAEYVAGGAGNAALMAFTKALGAHSLKNNIRVIGINPGLIKTERLETLMRSVAQDRLNDPDRWEELLPKSPPPGEPCDIANFVAFLASDCARFATGTVIAVDGGFTAG